MGTVPPFLFRISYFAFPDSYCLFLRKYGKSNMFVMKFDGIWKINSGRRTMDQNRMDLRWQKNTAPCFRIKGREPRGCSAPCVWHVTWRVNHLLLDQNTWYTRSENKSTQCGDYYILRFRLTRLSYLSHAETLRGYSILSLWLDIIHPLSIFTRRKNYLREK